MRTVSIAVAATVLAAAIVSPASADHDDARCPAVSSEQWMAIDAAAARAEGLGYSVKEIKRSKGCWKIEGFDRNGAEIEILLHPASGQPVKPRGWRAPSGG